MTRLCMGLTGRNQLHSLLIPESQVVQCQHLEYLNPLQHCDVYGTDLYEREKQLLSTV